MKVELEKGKLKAIADYFYNLTMVRKQSRMRRKFIRILDKHNEELTDDRKLIAEEHANKDADGEPIVKKEGYDIDDKVAFMKDWKELSSELIVIEGGDNREMLRVLKRELEKNLDAEYEGVEAEAFDYLCEQFKVDEGGDDNESTNHKDQL